jgi:hypothetical protein
MSGFLLATFVLLGRQVSGVSVTSFDALWRLFVGRTKQGSVTPNPDP